MMSSRKKIRSSSSIKRIHRKQVSSGTRKHSSRAGLKPITSGTRRISGGGRAEESTRATEGGYKTTPHIAPGRIKGMSLALKFTLAIGFMVAFFVLFFATVMYYRVEKNLYREKKINGLYFCSALSPFASVLLTSEGKMDADQFAQLKNVFKKHLKKDGIVNVAIARDKQGGGEEYLFALGSGSINIARGEEDKPLKIDNRVYKDIMLQEKGRKRGAGRQKVFWFKKSAVFDGKNAYIYVILSKKSIEQSQKKLVTDLAVIGIVFVVVGFFVGYGLASIVAKPVRQLVHDMALVSSGRLEHKTSAHSRDEIGLLANTFNLMTKSLLEAQKLEKEKLIIDSELTVASDIQARLLPERNPQIAGYQIVPFYRSAKDVGGDYYDFIPLDRDHLGIIVADVSGKGIIGSLVMSITRTVLRLVSQGNLSAADTLSKTNRVIARDIRRGMFVTAFYCILNARKREIIFSSAGHNPMVIYRSDKRKVELANPKGIALGFNKGPIFDKTVKQEKLTLNSGDMIILYTDGIVEAMDIHNREYTEDRFYKFTLENARGTASDFVSNLIADVDSHTGKAPQSDDITVVALKVE